MRPGGNVARSRETVFPGVEGDTPATLHLPSRDRGPLPGWVILHGLTRSGRSHPGLVRFCRALAASGHAVLVPEIVDWRELRVRPTVAVPLIRAAIRALDDLDVSEPGGVGLMGFSFGATQGLIAAADPETERHLRGVAAWGGYRDVHRLFHFGLTGRHELDGERWAVPPDPYGGWVMGANYLTQVPGYEDCRAVADALRRLAVEAGDSAVYAGSPSFDPVKAKHAVGLAGEDRRVYDLFAPPSTAWTADEDRSPEARAFAARLADAALAAEPLLDPGDALPLLAAPTMIAHGRDDRLVPFSEAFRLERDIPDGVVRQLAITGLFQHSGGTSQGLGPVGLAREGRRFLGMLRSILALTDLPAHV
jgi:pimeloyl-ACP methyl ester carboxylesterase